MKITSIVALTCAAICFLYATSLRAVPVTFQVNLAYQITNDFPTFDPLNDTVEVRGNFFDDWSSGIALVQVGNTTSYTNTVDITDQSPGDLVEFKFHTYGMFEDDWENLPGYIYTNDGNRAFILSSSTQVMPFVYFNDVWGGCIPVTFQVDMQPAIIAGNFVPGDDTLEVRGSWDGFSSGVTLTNDPDSVSSNIYTITYLVASYPAPGGLAAYKFHYYGSTHDIYEPRDNRFLLEGSLPTTAPLVFFNDLGTNDLLMMDTLVTFSINMTNAVGTDFYTFDPTVDEVFINGDFLGWWSWGYFPPPQYQMIQVGTSEVYTNTLLIPKGTPVALAYKYGIGESAYGYPVPDDEAPFKVNHLRYVRHTGSSTFPLDTFGTQLIEPVVGLLNVARPTSGHVNVTWDGHVGLHLQSSTNLSASSWKDLPETEVMSATNYATGANATYFRLIKP